MKWALGILVWMMAWACSGSLLPDAGVDAGSQALCSTNSDCGARSVCSGGVCVSNECTLQDECTMGMVCWQGECVPPGTATGCNGTEDCPPDYLCDGFSHRCFNPVTGEFLGGASSSSGGSGSSSRPPSSSSGGSSGGGNTVDLGGWRVENRQDNGSIQVAILPEGTLVPRGGLLLMARDCTQSQFESHWGVSLPASARFLRSGNANNGVPVINGDEAWSIYNPSNTRQDGPSVKGSTGKSFRRIHPGAPGSQASWQIAPEDTATPGATALSSADHGVLVSEWSDATADYRFEFIEVFVNP